MSLMCPACNHSLSMAAPTRHVTECRLPKPGEFAVCIHCFAPLRFVPLGAAGLSLVRLTSEEMHQHAGPLVALAMAGLDLLRETAQPGDYLVWRWPWDASPVEWIFLAHRNPRLACMTARGHLMPTLTRITAPGLDVLLADLDRLAVMSSAELGALLARDELPDPVPAGAARPLGPADMVLDLADGRGYIYRGAAGFEPVDDAN